LRFADDAAQTRALFLFKMMAPDRFLIEEDAELPLASLRTGAQAQAARARGNGKKQR
jgi:hypothetical protein